MSFLQGSDEILCIVVALEFCSAMLFMASESVIRYVGGITSASNSVPTYGVYQKYWNLYKILLKSVQNSIEICTKNIHSIWSQYTVYDLIALDFFTVVFIKFHIYFIKETFIYWQSYNSN